MRPRHLTLVPGKWPGRGSGRRARWAEPDPRARAQRLKISPEIVIAHTQPGLEGVAIREALNRIAGAREIGRRSIADRNGMALLRVERAQSLTRMRCAEDLFALAAYLRPLAPDQSGLEQARKLARNAPFVETALARRLEVTPGSRSGRRLDFRVLVRTTGVHDYRRVDLQKAIEQGIAERGDRRWRAAENAEVEFWATLLDDEL